MTLTNESMFARVALIRVKWTQNFWATKFDIAEMIAWRHARNLKLKMLLGITISLILCVSAFGQATPNCNQNSQILSAAGVGASYNNESIKCSVWKLNYFSTGFSVISIQLEGAPDNGSGAPGSWSLITATVTNGTNPLTSTTSGTVSVNAYFPFMRANLTTATGTGTVNYSLIGNAYVGDSSSVSSGGGVASNVNLQSVGGGSISLGQNTQANSVPVVLPSNPSTFPIKSVPNVPACGTTAVSASLQTVPTSLTAITWTGGAAATTTCVTFMVINNTTAGALTITIKDGQGSPVTFLNVFSIPANSQLLQPLYGLPFTTGVQWQASGAGLTGGAVGIQ